MSEFEILEHTADAGVRAQGLTREAVFENAAQGFYALALRNQPPAAMEKLSFHFQAENLESLLVRFLEAGQYTEGADLRSNFDKTLFLLISASF